MYFEREMLIRRATCAGLIQVFPCLVFLPWQYIQVQLIMVGFSRFSPTFTRRKKRKAVFIFFKFVRSFVLKLRYVISYNGVLFEKKNRNGHGIIRS